MQNYFLVLDTETSGLPKKWEASYSSKNNWPHVLQIAWIIYDHEGNEIKRENHYLEAGNFEIPKASTKIHKITRAFLEENGEDRLSVFKKFSEDILHYKPLIIAHFVELDFCMVSVEYHRLNLHNPLKERQFYCTLKASASYVKNPAFKFLRLGIFYKTLFKKRPENQHNALIDAQLTSEIFFHLLNKGEITPEIIEEQSASIKNRKELKPWTKLYYLIFVIFIIIICIITYRYGR